MLKKYIVVFLISMVPLVELRGAIPVAEYWQLNKYIAIPLIVLGNMLPVPIIYLFARKVLEWGKDKRIIGKFFTWCLVKGERGGKKLEKKASRGLYWALMLFVGIKSRVYFAYDEGRPVYYHYYPYSSIFNEFKVPQREQWE